MKKVFKIVGIIVLVLIIALVSAPYLFKSQIENMVKKTINKNINATVAWDDLDLSLFRSFPDAALTITDLSVINKAPFAGDTLASARRLQLDMGITQLFKNSSESIKVDALALEGAFINIKVDTTGIANYDVAIKDENIKKASSQDSGGFTFDVQHYEISTSRVNYLDESTKTFLRLKEFNHEGKGDLSAAITTLETQTEALVSFDLDGVNYLNDNKVKLKADLELDLDKQRYTFKDNEALINQLPLVFAGFIQVNESNNDIDLSFKTPSRDFKNFLAVIPEVYAKDLDGVTTTGDFRVSGVIRGIVDETHIPTLDIGITSNNASFKYPDLPKSVKNITIDTQIKNETGLLEDTYLRLGNLTFTIDEDTFAASGRIDRLTTNPLVDLALKGRLNLANLEQAYPLELDQDLNGMLTVNMKANFDMESVEKERYGNVKSSGTADLRDFKYVSPELPNPFLISAADVNFNTAVIKLEKLAAKTGETDLNASGSIENLIPFLLSKQDLKGRFNIRSKTINLADFNAAETTTVAETKEGKKVEKTVVTDTKAIKIPSFLDAVLDFTAGKVIYDNITLTNVKGQVIVKDETASLKNVSSNVFGGTVSLAGDVNTKGTTPTFDMKLDLSKVDIAQSFAGMDLLKGIAPIAKALQGALNTDISLKGNLNNDLTPILSSLAGDLFAQLLTVQLDESKMQFLQTIDSKLNFIDLKKINLNNLKTGLTFDNGKVSVKPFDFDVKGIKVNVSGSHSLENLMDYQLALDVPGNYLGSQLGGTLAKLSNADLDKYTVKLPISLTGNIKSPTVNVNSQAAINSLTQQIVATQKDKLKGKGEEKLNEVLGGLLGGNKTKDSTVTATRKDSANTQIKNTVKNVLGGLLNRNKKPADTTKGNE